jgi:hypothetical protein
VIKRAGFSELAGDTLLVGKENSWKEQGVKVEKNPTGNT